MMIADTMEELGIKRGSYVVKVNNRKVLDGVMEAIGIGGEENAASGSRCCGRSTSSTVRRRRVRLLLGDGRKDESGDFTKGRGPTMQATDRSSSSRMLTKLQIARRTVSID